MCYIKKIKDGDDVDSGGEDYDELVIEANCNYDNVLTPTDTSYDQKVIFRVEKAGEWLTVTYDAGFEDIKETHYKTTETLPIPVLLIKLSWLIVLVIKPQAYHLQ